MKISLFNPFSTEYTALKDFPKLTISQKITTIVLTILASLATLFVFGLGGVATFRALVKKYSPPLQSVPKLGIALITPLDTAIPPESNSQLLICPPVFNPSKGWEGSERKEFFKYHFDKLLNPQKKGIACSIDNGDCFFDSVAKTLSPVLQKKITLKDVRMTVKRYIDDRDHIPDNWIKKEYERNPDETYASLKESVAFTVLECPVPVWGNKTIAKIIANAYEIQLKIYSLGTYDLTLSENELPDQDQVYQIVLSGDIVEVLFIEDDETYGTAGKPMIEVACYTAGPNGHFFPVFDR